jgi:glutaredoxin
MNTNRIAIALAVLALAMLVFPSPAPADEGPKGTIKRDVNVYATMSKESDVMGHLDKGTKVIVESETENAEGGWCAVREPQEPEAMGYVLCRHVAREGGTLEEDKRPYSDVRVVLYMTEGCAYSKQARKLLQGLGVDLIVYDVMKNQKKALEMVDISGKKSVPFVDIEGVHITGYYEKAIKEAVESAR